MHQNAPKEVIVSILFANPGRGGVNPSWTDLKHGLTHSRIETRTNIRWLWVCTGLTLSSPVMSNGYTSQCSVPYWSNTSFLISDIRALWRSGLSARVPECRKIKNGGLDQYGTERFGRLIFETDRKSVGLKGLKHFAVSTSD